MRIVECDVLVGGIGAAGLAAAAAAGAGSRHLQRIQGERRATDSLATAREYVGELAGDLVDPARLATHLAYGLQMVDSSSGKPRSSSIR